MTRRNLRGQITRPPRPALVYNPQLPKSRALVRPDADEGGLRNNGDTNVMVAWIAEKAHSVLDLLPESRREALSARLGLSAEDIARWDEMSRKMFVPFHDDGIISQFEGYEELAELDWDAYRANYGKIQRRDRILRAEGDDPDRYKLAKQADTVMLFYLFSEEQLRHLFERLGYEYRSETARRNIDYYDARTSHGSTLSFITHAAVLAALDPQSSWDRFTLALESDIGDVQGGTTKEGIHLGVMAGTLDLIQRGYVGSVIRDGVVHFGPRLLDRLDGLSFPMQFRGTPLRVTLGSGALTVVVPADGFSRPVRVAVGDEVRELHAGDEYTFAVDKKTSATEVATERSNGDD
jgi:trehalose/maltose hydrolase-like predicted phosphorylase